MRNWIVTMLACSTAALAACGGSTTSAPPTASASPASGSNVTVTQGVVVSFSAPMNPASLSLSGSLVASTNTFAAWASSSVFTLAPASGWPVGTGKSLVISASGSDGQALAPLTLTYAVDAGLGNCSPGVAGACNNATDCAYGLAEFAAMAQTCVVSTNLGTAAQISACIDTLTPPNNPTTACSTCVGNFAACAVASCGTPCQAGFSTPACTTCLVASGCTSAYLTCSGR